ncbi:hypothetical protein L7F22_027732 [Adiantum nelumboides]|nr:hypothetical protein [Adiantum nelumboides]
MGLHWLSKYGLFIKRRKYTRVLGGQGQEPFDPFPPDPPRIHRQKQKKKPKQTAWPSPSLVRLQDLKKNDDLDLHRDAVQLASNCCTPHPPSKLLRVASLGFLQCGQPPPAQKVAAQIDVENFLAGPLQVGDKEELYQRQCRELLRRLSARNNRIV